MAMWEVVSACPRCGAPIWARRGWVDATIPPHEHACDCFTKPATPPLEVVIDRPYQVDRGENPVGFPIKGVSR
jgi:hypothetical protein